MSNDRVTWYWHWVLIAVAAGVSCNRTEKGPHTVTSTREVLSDALARSMKLTTYTDSQGKVVELLIYRANFHAQPLTGLEQYNDVRRVVFQECQGVGLDTISKLRTLPHLEYLTIMNSPVEESLIDWLPNLPQLRSLRLINCGLQGTRFPALTKIPLEQVEILDQQLTVEGANVLAAIPTLRSLTIGSPRVQIADMRALANHQQLEYLDMALCDPGADWVGVVATIPNLKRIRFNARHLTDEVLAQLVRISTLEELDLSSSPVTDNSLRLLSPLTSLQRLILRNCENLTDDALTHVAELSQLTRLEISEASVSADALPRLIPLTSLKEVVIHQMQVRGRRAGLTAFQQARPDCVVTVEQDLMF